MGWATDLELDNLVPYTEQPAAWSDRHSWVALTWTKPEAAGLQVVEALVGWGGTVLTEQLLAWTVWEGEQKLDVSLTKRVFRPDIVTETDEGGGMRVTAAAAWAARNVLAVQFRVENRAARERTLTVRFDYPGKGVPPTWEGALQAGSPVSIEDEPEGSWSTLFLHREHGRNFTWVSEFVAGMPETTLEAVCLAELADRTMTLAAGETSVFTVSLSFAEPGRARACSAMEADCGGVDTRDGNGADMGDSEPSASTACEIRQRSRRAAVRARDHKSEQPVHTGRGRLYREQAYPLDDETHSGDCVFLGYGV